MVGVQKAPARLFYGFDVEAHVPADRMLRKIDRFLDVGTIRQQPKPYYSHPGRPSVDPELIVRMLVIGYVPGIRSGPRLCEEVHLNLAYRWFCRLGLDDKVPDHSTFSKYRPGKFRDSDLLGLVFEAVVARCIFAGLVGGHGFAVDASLIEADVDRMNASAQQQWGVSAIAPDDAPRAVREYATFSMTRHLGRRHRPNPSLRRIPTPPANGPRHARAPAIFTYSNNYLIGTDNAVIVDVKATRSVRTAEAGASQTMVDRTEDRFGQKPDWQVADTAYGSAENLAWLVKKREIIPFIPLIDKSERKDGTFSRSDFEWDEANDRYICPEGKHPACSPAGTILTHAGKSQKPAAADTGRPRSSVMSAHQNQGAARTQTPGSLVAKNTRMRGISHGWLRSLTSPQRPKPNARKPRCSSRISNASLASGGFG